MTFRLLRSLLTGPLLALSLAAQSDTPETWDDAELDRLILGEEGGSPKSVAELPSLKRPWMWEGQLSLGFGWASNPLFLDDSEPGARFLSTGLEIYAARPGLPGHWSWLGYGIVEQRHFLEHRNLFEDETVALLYGRALTKRGWLTAGLTAQASYNDQAFGVALSPVATETVGLTAYAFLLQPELEAQLTRTWRARLSLPQERLFFTPSTDDYWEPAAQLAIGGKRGQTEFELSARGGYRDYDDRPTRSIFGTARPGTHLVWRTWRTELVWRQSWDASRHLRSTSRLRWRGQRDNAAGYDDYAAWEFIQDLTWQLGSWEIELSGSYGEPQYRYQRPVVAIPVERALEQTYGVATLRYELSPRWQIAGSLAYDQLRSNKVGEDYRNTVFSFRVTRLFGSLISSDDLFRLE